MLAPFEKFDAVGRDFVASIPATEWSVAAKDCCSVSMVAISRARILR
jgi:hypothetical protein